MTDLIDVTETANPDGTRHRSAPDFKAETDALFVNFDSNGVTYLRSLIPAQAMRASLWVRDGAGLRPRLQIGRMDQPVVVYQMPREPFMFEEVAELLSKGVKVIADVDDLLVSFIGKPDHPNAEKYTEQYIADHEEAILACDLVTCSTQFIADYYAAKGARTMVIPNALSLDRWDGLRHANKPRLELVTSDFQKLFPSAKSRQAAKDADAVYIGFACSVGHDEAFKAIAPTISRVIRENPNARFVSIGWPMLDKMDPDVIKTGRCGYMNFVPFPELPKILTQLHISLAPTLDDDFYRSKSDLRVLEAWASGSVVVGGRPTYGETLTHGEDGFVCDKPADYYSALTLLVSDQRLRMETANAGYQSLVDGHLIEHTVPLWLEAIGSV